MKERYVGIITNNKKDRYLTFTKQIVHYLYEKGIHKMCIRDRDCGATSLEPFYSNVVYKSLAGGGMMELVNPVLEDALINLGYSSEQVEKIKDYLLEKDENGMFVHFNLDDAPYLREEDKKIFETANDISPSGHVLMVAAVTPMISLSLIHI